MDQYADRDVPPLNYCVADAATVAEYLSLDHYGFSVKLVLDADATRHHVMGELAGAIDDPPDFLLLYFSGHGAATNLGAYLVTYDARPYDEGISLEHLSSVLDRASAVIPHCLIILDCCHAGAGAVGFAQQPVSVRDLDSGIVARSESKVLLGACRPEQMAEEDSGLGHGIFTYALLNALDGQAADERGDVTVGGIAEFIGRELEAQGCEQVMVAKGDSAGRVVLATGLRPRVRELLPSEAKRRFVAQAKQFLDEYTSRLSSSLDDWKGRGYLQAAQSLTPTLRWFENRISEYPDLRKTPEFLELFDAAKNRARQLAEIDLGTVIAQGVVAEYVGGGGFGSVWRVDGCERVLAYKVYHAVDYNLKEKRQLFSRGYRAMQQLDHPRVIKVYGDTECPIGFFMEYIEGPSLRDLPTAFEEADELLRFLILAGETISHAHSRGVIHRDIKPENILATYDFESNTWTPFLTDFDLAWFSQATQVTKQAWGNLSYAAPEQMANPRSHAAHARTVDIYAFGQLAFYAVTGTDPTPVGRADNSRALRERLERWPVASAAEKFLAWYERCTAANPADRYEDFVTTMDELFSIEALIRDEVGRDIDENSLLREVAFALSGFGANDGTAAFPSTSGRTNIELRIERSARAGEVLTVDLSAKLTLHRITMEASSNERGRLILNNRIDEVIRGVVGARRVPGSHGTFSTTIHIPGIPASRAGVERFQQVIRRVLDAIER